MPCMHPFMTWVVSLAQWIGTTSYFVCYCEYLSRRFLPDLLHLQMASPEPFPPRCPTGNRQIFSAGVQMIIDCLSPSLFLWRPGILVMP
ncbi:hypothetical protein BDW71DRAFT_154070 [Aspergillus fruticulosus]